MSKVFYIDDSLGLKVTYKELIAFLAGEIFTISAKIPGVSILCNILGKKQVKTFEDIVSIVKESSTEVSLQTGGTTGLPQTVIHDIQTLIRYVRPSSEDDVWGFAYHSEHIAGMQVFFQAFMNGNTMVNLFAKRRDYILAQINKYQITHLSATPTFYRCLLPTESCSSVHRVTTGGERLDWDLYEQLVKMFPNARIRNVYALTEAGTVLTSHGKYFSIPEWLKDKIMIKDNLLWLHQSLLGRGVKFKGNWYNTGDQVERVNEQEFQFVARQGVNVSIGGYTVNPIIIEELIRQIEGIKDVRVYTRHNSVLGNVLLADIVVTREITEDEIKEWLKDRVMEYSIPTVFYFVDEIKMNWAGKVTRHEA